MANLRLLLSIALPSVTALIGFLYFVGRKRGKGPKAITDKNKDKTVGDGDKPETNDNHDMTLPRRRRERDKELQNTCNSQSPQLMGNNSFATKSEKQLTPAREINTNETVKSNCENNVNAFPKVLKKSQNAWSSEQKPSLQTEAPVEFIQKDDIAKTECAPKSMSNDLSNTISASEQTLSQKSVTILSRSPRPVSTDEHVSNESETLAKSRENSQDRVGANISTQEVFLSHVNDEVSASEGLMKCEQASASKSSSFGSPDKICDSKESGSPVKYVSNISESSPSSLIIEDITKTENDSCFSDVSLMSNSVTSPDQGTSTVKELSLQSPSAASEITTLTDSANNTEGGSMAAESTPSVTKVTEQNGSAAIAGSSESPGCDSNSEASNDSGRGGSVTEPLPLPVMLSDTVRYEFNFPSELCGRLIGKNGRNINLVKEKSGANIALKNNPCTPNFQICVIEGKQSEIDRALVQIRRKFPRGQYPQVDYTPVSQVVQETPVLMPDIMTLNLPEGVSIDIVVSNIVDAGHIFVQQPTHPTFPSLERLNHFMMACYTQDHMVPPLPRPIEIGVICAAFMVDGWFRAQVVNVVENSDEIDIKYVDYGGYARLPSSQLKQIRSDFMTLPFQAVECYMGNITPLQEEEYFSEQCSTVLEELTQGKLLQAQVVNRAEDGVPYIHIYQISGNRVLFINREMVNRKVVRWIEILQ